MSYEIDSQGSWFATRKKFTPEETALANEMGVDVSSFVSETHSDTPRGIDVAPDIAKYIPPVIGIEAVNESGVEASL